MFNNNGHKQGLLYANVTRLVGCSNTPSPHNHNLNPSIQPAILLKILPHPCPLPLRNISERDLLKPDTGFHPVINIHPIIPLPCDGRQHVLYGGRTILLWIVVMEIPERFEQINQPGKEWISFIGIRAFYVHSYIVFIFCNDPHTLADVVREKTKEHIRRYNDQYCLDADELERYSGILVPE